ncbi:MAG TPA: hypothetical protein VF135_03045 [Terriglobales bacterium]
MAETAMISATSSAVLTREPFVTPAFARAALSYSAANLFVLLIGAVSAFAIPKLVSIEAYAALKLFLLYGGYVGVLHFGLLDGALVHWARNPQSLSREFLSVSVAANLLCVAGCIVGTAYWYLSGRGLHGVFVVALASLALVSIATTSFQFASQARCCFDQLSRLTIVQPAIFLGSVFLLTLSNNVSGKDIVLSYVSSATFAFLAYAFVMRDRISWNFQNARETASLCTSYVRRGVFILLANLGFNLILGLDRIYLSAHASLKEFALYSFAATIFYSACLMIQAMARVAFPYVSRQPIRNQAIPSILSAQRAVLSLWAIGLSAFFPMAFLIGRFLPAYIGSIALLRIILLGLGAVALTQIVHANFFRANGMERRLLVGTCTGLLAFGISLSVGPGFVSLNSVAWAAVIGHISWWLANDALLWKSGLRSPLTTGRDFSSLILIGIVYLFCSRQASACGFAAYLLFAVGGCVLVLGPKTILQVAENIVFAAEATS